MDEAAADVFGYSAAEAVGERVQDLDIHPPATEDAFAERFREAMAGKTFQGLEVERRTRDGEPIHLRFSTAPLRDEEGEFGGVMAIAEDVTDQHERDAALSAMERRLDIALEETGTGVYEWELETGEVEWTESMEELVGLDTGAFEGTEDAVMARIYDADLDDVSETITDAVEAGGGGRSSSRWPTRTAGTSGCKTAPRSSRAATARERSGWSPT